MSKVRHLGLIPDGGRRWARSNAATLRDSYLVSMEKLCGYCDAIFGLQVEAISVYLLSRANLTRTQPEIDAACHAACEFLNTMLPRLSGEADLCLRVAGRLELLPDQLHQACIEAVSRYASGKKLMFLCLAYDPFDELCQAALKQRPWQSKQDVLRDLWVPKEIDLVLRTGGAITLSQFLPIQTSYSRIVFLEKLFNDTTVEEVLRFITDHEERELLYGE